MRARVYAGAYECVRVISWAPERRNDRCTSPKRLHCNLLSGVKPMADGDEAPRLRSVLVIYTGGTIGMQPTPRGYTPAPGYLQSLVSTMPMFHDAEHAHLIAVCSSEMDDGDPPASGAHHTAVLGRPMISPEDPDGRRFLFRFLDYDPLMDSSNMTHVEWRHIARDILRYYSHFDGFVVLHGTDTMAYTASALSFFLENLGKPVVLTGSQIPICRQRNDGLMNLVGALNVAAFHHIPEACLPPLARPPARNP